MFPLACRNVTGDILSSPANNSVVLDGDEEGRPLAERLKSKPGEDIDPVPPQLLRKYIAYARKYVQPQLSKESAKVLQVKASSCIFFEIVCFTTFM